MRSEDSEACAPILVILALIVGLGVYHEIAGTDADPKPVEIADVASTPR